jgi:hypothetical protein
VNSFRLATRRRGLAAGVVAAALTAGVGAPAASAGVSLGSACGGSGTFVTDSCNFIPLTAAVAVHAAAAPTVFSPVVRFTPPIDAPVVKVTVTLTRSGTSLTGCSATSTGAAECQSPVTVPSGWVGNSVQCSVTETVTGELLGEPAIEDSGEYACAS